MLNESNRQLHFLLGRQALETYRSLHRAIFKKKYPGAHVALVREENLPEVSALDFFDEVHPLDLSLIQRTSFSPILGDEIAFSYFHTSLASLAHQKWARLFNLSLSAADTALTEVFHAPQVVGACARKREWRCQDSPLKLSHLMTRWHIGHPEIARWMLTKVYGQLDWTEIEGGLQRIAEAKNSKHKNTFKNLVIAVSPEARAELSLESIDLIERLFTVVELEAGDVLTALFADMVMAVPPAASTPWQHTLLPHQIDPEQLPEVIAEAVPKALVKWAMLSPIFDYLGNARAALAAEKIMGRYDRDALQQFLHSEVMALKDFSKILLDGIRRGNADTALILTHLSSRPGTLGLAAAVELSLHSGLTSLIRSESDLQALKTRMRSLNQFYERIHRATALDMPKTDLALTL